ncbi:MAG TPA: UDP-N-acetylmuramate--L-alanine ligase [Clostridiales bacterium]|nr:UDP-N-acetylmuramate--L-alanine ligase [Clostridiales bacterium]
MSLSHSEIPTKVLLTLLENRALPILFVGVGGVSVRTLAMYSARLGYPVRGCDREESPATDALRAAGIFVTSHHAAENARGAGLVVYTLAVPEDVPELRYAREHHIPAVSRAEFLGALMTRFGTRIGVSGSHGKSGTTAKLAAMFRLAGRRPTVFCGADLGEGTPWLFGGEDTLIYEACEYRDSFLHFFPTVSVFLNLELDHTDYFPDLDALTASFLAAADRSPVSVLNADDRNLRTVAERTKSRPILFGEGEDFDFGYRVTDISHGYVTFRAYEGGEALGDVTLGTPGRFQAVNATAAIAAARTVGIDFSYLRAALHRDTGIPRRLERLGTFRGRPVYYDYAHHPTEIRTTLKTLSEMTGGGVTVIFSPHTYSRTAALFSDFVGALRTATSVVLLPIYPAREAPIPDITSEALAEAIGESAVVQSAADAVSYVVEHTEGAIVLLGAGDLTLPLAQIRASLDGKKP